MHRVRLKLGGFSRRWYGFKVRNDLFCPGNKAGGLILNVNQRGLARILWKYFNAPGNVMFVTMNIVTFAGIVTYSSLISASRERLAEDRLLLTQESLDQRSMWSTEQQQPRQEIELLHRKETQDVTEQEQMHSGTEAEVTALPEYKAGDISVPKYEKCDSYRSQMARMSLFHMIYAYFLCKQVALGDSKTYAASQIQASQQWKREVKALREEIDPQFLASQEKYSSRSFMDIFYSLWRNDFVEVFSDLTKSQQFHFPDWKYYPLNLRYVCKALYASDMSTIEDFQKFYDSVEPRDLKRLLRLWLFDYSHLIKPTKAGNTELFYQKLIKDCHNDDRLFGKYSSLLFKPEDPRRKLFFRSQANVPSASIETVLNVLQEYVSLRERLGTPHYNAIIRLISMIRKDCVVAHQSSNLHGSPQVRILLPTEDDRPRLQARTTTEQRKQCFQLVSRNPKLVKLLTAISSWQNPGR